MSLWLVYWSSTVSKYAGGIYPGNCQYPITDAASSWSLQPSHFPPDYDSVSCNYIIWVEPWYDLSPCFISLSQKFSRHKKNGNQQFILPDAIRLTKLIWLWNYLKEEDHLLIIVSHKHEAHIKLMQMNTSNITPPYYPYKCSKTHSTWFVLSQTCRLPRKIMDNHFGLAIRLPSKTNIIKNIKQSKHKNSGMQT